MCIYYLVHIIRDSFFYHTLVLFFIRPTQNDTYLSSDDVSPLAVDVEGGVLLEPLLQVLERGRLCTSDFLPRLTIDHRHILVSRQGSQVKFAGVDAGSSLLPGHFQRTLLKMGGQLRSLVVRAEVHHEILH